MKLFKEYKLLEERTLKKKKKETNTTYSHLQPHFTEHEKVITNTWNLPRINKEFQDIFQQIPVLAFRKNKSLYYRLGYKNFVNNSVQKNSKNKIGFSTKCFSKSRNLFSK